MGTTSGTSSPVDHAAPPGDPALRWRRVFAGDEVPVREARRWLTGLLPPCPQPLRSELLPYVNSRASPAPSPHTWGERDGSRHTHDASVRPIRRWRGDWSHSLGRGSGTSLVILLGHTAPRSMYLPKSVLQEVLPKGSSLCP